MTAFGPYTMQNAKNGRGETQSGNLSAAGKGAQTKRLQIRGVRLERSDSPSIA